MAPKKTNKEPLPRTLVFDGCSWGCVYYLGVYDALHAEHTPTSFAQCRWGGWSSGALFALAGALYKTPDECRALLEEMSAVAERNGVFGNMSIYHDVALLRWLPDDGREWARLNERLWVGVTRSVARFEWVTRWTSNADVRATIHGSMHLPYYMTCTDLVQGRRAIDGGFAFTRAAARIDDHTTQVSATRLSADIHPVPALTLSQCFSPVPRTQRRVLERRGYEDAVRQFQAPRKVKPDGALTARSPLRCRRLALCVVGWALRWCEERRRTTWYGLALLLLLLLARRAATRGSV